MPVFDLRCRRCPRLSGYLAGVARDFPDYHARPVAPFGDPAARLLIVGLAPGKHGANATGRPFTGDHAGILLYRTLHRLGLASGPHSRGPDDDLRLIGCRITNAVKCLPPDNRPTTEEIRTCNDYLHTELAELADRAVVLALGGIAHNSVLRALGLRQSAYRFGHGVRHDLGRITMVDSYHCSRYNTQTKRLTEAMFVTAVRKASRLAAS